MNDKPAHYLTVGLAQIAPYLGNIKANLDKHLEWVDKAASQSVDLLIFPELSLTGYVIKDLVPTVAARPAADDPYLGPLIAASRAHDMDMMVGFVEHEARHRYYIAAAYISQGEIKHVHRKVYLPTYGMFDEGRYLAVGDQVRAFDTRWGRLGMLICEDFWHVSPPYLLWVDGADMLVMHSASPGRGMPPAEPDRPSSQAARLNSSRFVELVNQMYASVFTNFTLHCNRVGFEEGVNFWGGSTIFGPDGECMERGPYYEEALIVKTIDLADLRRARIRLPLLRDERPQMVLRELQRSLGG